MIITGVILILHLLQIITIKRAKAQKRNSQFHDPEDGVGPIELSTTQVSTVVIKNFLFHPLRVPISPQHQGKTTFNN